MFIFCSLLINVGSSEKAYAEFESLSERERTLVIGKISSNPKKHYPYLKPMANYVASKMEDLGIKQSRVLFAKDIKQMLEYIRQGKIDWVTETPLIASVLQEKANAEIFLLKRKKGVPEYHSVFFTYKNNGIDSFDDLVGKTIVFQDKGSTSAYLIPAAMLLDHGLKMIEMDSVRSKPPVGAVGYVFTKEEINMSTWVHKKIVDAGAFSDLDWKKKDKLPDTFREDLKVFARSRPFPRALELTHENLNLDIKHRLKKILLNIHMDPDAKPILKAYQSTTRFDEIDDRIRTGLKEIRRMKLLVNSVLN